MGTSDVVALFCMSLLMAYLWWNSDRLTKNSINTNEDILYIMKLIREYEERISLLEATDEKFFEAIKILDKRIQNLEDE